MKQKMKNPMFWIGLISTIFLAAGIEPDTLTTWTIVVDSLKSIVQNPYVLVAVIVSIIAVFNDNGTKGLDNPFKK